MKFKLTNPIVLILFLGNVLLFQNCGRFQTASDSDLFGLQIATGSSRWLAGAAAGVKPLTVREYDASVAMLLKDTSKPGRRILQGDERHPFDNSIEEQLISEGKVQQFELAAEQVTQSLLADDARLRSILPCVPSGTSDQTCFKSIIEKLGLLAFHRPVDAAEVTALSSLIQTYATRGANYKSGLEVFFRILLQHPDFLYRWERGTANVNSQTFELNDLELATKLAFTLHGEPPTLDLLQAAQAGKLSDPVEFTLIVDGMLQSPKFLNQIDTFVSMWIGYARVTGTDQLSIDMRKETKALLERIVVSEDRPWTELFTLDETYLTPTLATHYGLNQPTSTSGGWVKYNTADRRGILAHASFLSLGEKFGDTSPTQRGYFIRKQLFCHPIGAPPDDIDALKPIIDAVASPCKDVKLYGSVLKPGTTCIGCHSQMDTIGLGLEKYDLTGKFRTTQKDTPECQIKGDGEVYGYGRFSGPAELARLAIMSGRAESCLIERWINFVDGSKTDPKIDEYRTGLLSDFKKHGRIKTLVRNTVLAPTFKQRRKLD